MTAAARILDRMVAWAGADPNVRALVLVGSRAGPPPPDDLADIDVQVYAREREPFTTSDAWISEIGSPWLCVSDDYAEGGIAVPTRLVIFEGGAKADFAFYPAGAVSAAIETRRPHRTLVDKDRAFDRSGSGTRRARQSTPPGAGEFRRVVEEFWFEAYHVAKYLVRGELWLAKSRDWAAKRFLLRMIAWHEAFVCGQLRDVDFTGARSTMSAETWEALQRTSAGSDREASWDATVAMMELFRRLAEETAPSLGLLYPAEIGDRMFEFILGLRQTDG